jgi:hypothetical protein
MALEGNILVRKFTEKLTGAGSPGKHYSFKTFSPDSMAFSELAMAIARNA